MAESQLTNPVNQEQLEDWMKFARSTRFATVISVTSAGVPAARPLTTQRIDGLLGADYFIAVASGLEQQLQDHPQVALAYTDHVSGKYLVFNGRASTRRDPALVRELWSKMSEVFFPAGPDDPDLRLLHVDLEHAEMWEPESSRPAQLIKIAAAAVGMDVDADKLGRHSKTDL